MAIALLVAAAAILSLLALLLIRGERRREILLLEYETERTAGSLLEAFRDGSLEAQAGGAGVVAFGLYNFAGEALVRVGGAPAVLAPDEAPQGEARFSHDAGRRTVTLVRSIGMASMRPMMRMPGFHRPGAGPGLGPGPGPDPRAARPQLAAAPASLYLEMSTEERWRLRHRLQAAEAVVPLAIAAMATLAGYLYWKNAGYRRRMAAQEQLARLGEVARTLAHEIKNPLGAIRLQTGILRRTVQPEGAAELTLIEEEVSRLALLSDRMGAFLREPRGEPRPVEVGSFLQGLLARFGQRVRLRVEPEASAASISFDPDRLRSVLENLLTNALESGTTEQPEVAVTAVAGRIEIAVLDRGTGIAAEDAERVFDPFFTRKTTGSGVGLAIARSFAEAAGAELRLDPRPGGGTAARLVARRVVA